jgi:hypothetical protein
MKLNGDGGYWSVGYHSAAERSRRNDNHDIFSSFILMENREGMPPVIVHPLKLSHTLSSVLQ